MPSTTVPKGTKYTYNPSASEFFLPIPLQGHTTRSKKTLSALPFTMPFTTVPKGTECTYNPSKSEFFLPIPLQDRTTRSGGNHRMPKAFTQDIR